MEPKKIEFTFFLAEKAISQYINHPYKGPNFDQCHTKLKIELKSCRRRFRTYSGAFWIGAQKKLNFFSGTNMAPSNQHLGFNLFEEFISK